jgi:DNA polymerase III delta prime subunit
MNKTICFTDKYKPNYFSDIVSHENIIKILSTYIKNNDFPNALIYGSPGVGKSSTIHSAMNELFKNKKNLNVLNINVSEERGVEIVRNSIISFISNSSIDIDNNIKVVILDEADNLTTDAQITIKSIIDINKNVRFCFICNYEKKIIDQITSRCLLLKFSYINFDEIIKKCDHICMMEKIYISKKALKIIIKNCNNDIRKILNILQSLSIAFEKQIILKSDILKYLKIPAKCNILNIIKLFKSSKSVDEKLNIYKEKYNKYDIIKIIYGINKYNKNNNYMIKKLSILEENVYSGIYSDILLIGLISLFI